ncbi:hypothetical protein FRC03_004795 [Tulasnella sp. 419]|nr:hypothetical protein FRC03_004795 [Tulasnella sp. 419]
MELVKNGSSRQLVINPVSSLRLGYHMISIWNWCCTRHAMAFALREDGADRTLDERGVILPNKMDSVDAYSFRTFLFSLSVLIQIALFPFLIGFIIYLYDLNAEMPKSAQRVLISWMTSSLPGPRSLMPK